uniref:Uncharacterized protein n=1 Tax=Acrobeloides nanus TaxID=290746 RepID=A0A914EEU2_9BILA
MKIFWFIITASMACGFFYQLIFQLIRTYLSYPVNVDTKIDYGKRVFPAVTFCMLNPWKTTNITGTPLDDLVSSYLDDDYASSKYGFTIPSTTIRTQRAAKWTQLMYEELKNIDETDNQILSYGYDELFIKCVFNTKDCDES